MVKTAYGTRAKLFLDDMITAVAHAEKEYKTIIDAVPSHITWACKRELFAIVLEFVFVGTVACGGKVYRGWSALRAYLQQNLLKVIKDVASKLPDAEDSNGLVTKLAEHLNATELKQQATGEFGAAAQALTEFLEENSLGTVWSTHNAFTTMVQKLKLQAGDCIKIACLFGGIGARADA